MRVRHIRSPWSARAACFTLLSPPLASRAAPVTSSCVLLTVLPLLPACQVSRARLALCRSGGAASSPTVLTVRPGRAAHVRDTSFRQPRRSQVSA